jgi:hypothetical protein
MAAIRAQVSGDSKQVHFVPDIVRDSIGDVRMIGKLSRVRHRSLTDTNDGRSGK